MLFLTATVVARNLRITDAFEALLAEDRRRAEKGLAPKTRKRKRKTLADLATVNSRPGQHKRTA